jgi:hypothetical protein
MSGYTHGLPAEGEYHPILNGYMKRATQWPDPVARLEAQGSEILALLGPLDAGKQLYRYAEGKWSLKQVLGHIMDCERIFACRVLRFARADATPLPGFEENDYAVSAKSDDVPWADLLDEFAAVRKASVRLLKNLPAEAWMRTGTANNKTITVRALAFMLVGHAEHHIALIRERYLV